MILQGAIKTKAMFFGDERIYAVFMGENLMYNCYAIPEVTHIYLNHFGESREDIVSSNTIWNIKQ